MVMSGLMTSSNSGGAGLNDHGLSLWRPRRPLPWASPALHGSREGL